MQKHLNKHSTVLDIGAGTGAFALPIAQLVKEVTVVEPSLDMLARLGSKMNCLTNVRLISKRWEDVTIEEVGIHDMIIAAHSLYDITDIETALKKMLSAAKKHLYIIIGTDKPRFYANIWQRFKKEEYHPSPSFIHLYNILYELVVPANVELIKTSQDQIYESINQAVNSWQMRLDLEPVQENELRRYLLHHLEENDGKYCLPGEGRNAIISVELPTGDSNC
jgi:ubiquinone/menaquinone biosynthesis C-methylase UbiE